MKARAAVEVTGLLLGAATAPAPIGPGALRTVAPIGDRGTLVADVDSPGGPVTDGDTLCLTIGNSAAAGYFDTRTGTGFDGTVRKLARA
ncbi:MAG: hypothetical protein QME72_11465 [Rhodococcus sp. (in: high G+C Gram-positive bacteria)]|nr:hypothetical protein [Rhodococcus sp. (in: high G+C Gram-positive bacteria)]MDI6628327.1 hypothetical protein [Rhodococcus sp. (in: high G+C Gram-positive bacteria)]